jgi:hypothetical protein
MVIAYHHALIGILTCTLLEFIGHCPNKAKINFLLYNENSLSLKTKNVDSVNIELLIPKLIEVDYSSLLRYIQLRMVEFPTL